MTDNLPAHEFHEIWWIFSQGEHEWCGLRIAHFRKASSSNGGTDDIVVIQGEVDPRRVGVRIWDDIKDREGWRKVKQIAIPDADEIAAAIK
jgi:hypothetical protein